MKKENLAKVIMAEYEKDGEPISYEEALEVAEMEIKAGNVKRYEQSAEKKERKTPTRKADEDKQTIIADIFKAMKDFIVYDNLEISNKERQIDFNFKGGSYSITLTKHRPPKK